MTTDFFTDHPEVLAVLIALVGFLVANVLAGITDRVLTRIDGYLHRRAGGRMHAVDLRAVRRAFRGLVYYGSLVFFLLLAIQTLGIAVMSSWLGQLLRYVPDLILGGLIILVGYFIGLVLRSLVASIVGGSSDHLAPRLVQALVMTAAVLTGLAQTAIDISFITSVLVIVVAFFFGGLSLAFALGSRQLVQNLLARRALDRYRIGDLIVVNQVRGRIVEILSTAVVLETEEGIVTVSTSRFIDAEVLRIPDPETVEADAGPA